MVDIDTIEAGLELRILLAERIMGWQQIDADTPLITQRDRGGYIYDGVPYVFVGRGLEVHRWQPDVRIDHAWLVVEKLRRTNDGDWLWRITDVVGQWVAVLMDEHGQAVARSGFCDTAPLAICRVALKAREVANG